MDPIVFRYFPCNGFVATQTQLRDMIHDKHNSCVVVMVEIRVNGGGVAYLLQAHHEEHGRKYVDTVFVLKWGDTHLALSGWRKPMPCFTFSRLARSSVAKKSLPHLLWTDSNTKCNWAALEEYNMYAQWDVYSYLSFFICWYCVQSPVGPLQFISSFVGYMRLTIRAL